MTDTLRNYRQALAGLKRRKRFVHVSETGEYARDLEGILGMLGSATVSPEEGLDGVVAFFKCDECIYAACDDSNGTIGEVFSFQGAELFVRCAQKCEDKDRLCQIVLDLVRDDNYGVRGCIIERAVEFLPANVLRSMVDSLWREAAATGDDYAKRHALYGICDLARQLKDGTLLEKAHRAVSKDLGGAACLDIAEVYFAAGDLAAAMEWVDSAGDSNFVRHKRDALELEIRKRMHDHAGAAEVAWRVFRESRSEESLESLISVIGARERERVVGEAVAEIRRSPDLSHTDVHFLLGLRRFKDAGEQIIEHAAELDGNSYYELRWFAESLEAAGESLAAVLAYRALIEANLAGALSRYYSHGVRYLKRLDVLAGQVADWRTFARHEEYKADLMEKQKRKTAFWKKYEGKKNERSSRRNLNRQ